MKIKYLEKGFSSTNFNDNQHDQFKIAELIVANETNRLNKGIIAIRSLTEEGKPDINIYDRFTNELIGYIETQGIENFRDVFNYKYPDFLFYERRTKEYKLPTIFIAFDLPTNSYLLCPMNKLLKAVSECNSYEEKDRMFAGKIIKELEKIYHLPLDIFNKYNGMDKLDSYFLKNKKPQTQLNA